MKNSIQYLSCFLKIAIFKLYNLKDINLNLQYTKKVFKGDITLIIFNLSEILKKQLDEIGNNIGSYAKNNIDMILSFNLVNGFLNFTIKDDYYINWIEKTFNNNDFLKIKNSKNKTSIMIEYCSPNTNKPLHLGHLRNILLGNSISLLYKTIGYNVIKIQIINDRGIHICKSMATWKKFGKNKTPKDAKIKGDHFVGKYYTYFDKIWKKEINDLIIQGYKKKEAEKKSLIMKMARKILIKWESNDSETLKIWNNMNNWVYEGFKKTYNRLGINFDVNQYESNTYLLGKNIIKKGLKKNIFYKKEDDSIWIKLKNYGLSDKLLLRSDGTSVYITQDIGTIIDRFNNYSISKIVYVVGKEQDHHFKILSIILNNIGYNYLAKKIFHLSYGTVNLPYGKIKSRDGNSVSIDNLMNKMYLLSYNISIKSEKLINSSEEFKKNNSEIIAQAALKYFLLKVHPNKNILFNPNKSIDFKGDTGPYIQYTYTRIYSLNKKYNIINNNNFKSKKYIYINKYERKIIKILENYKSVVKNAAENFNPALLANYIYKLSNNFNDFYQNVNILHFNSTNEIDNKEEIFFRMKLSILVGKVLLNGMNILGIDMPKKM